MANAQQQPAAQPTVQYFRGQNEFNAMSPTKKKAFMGLGCCFGLVFLAVVLFVVMPGFGGGGGACDSPVGQGTCYMYTGPCNDNSVCEFECPQTEVCPAQTVCPPICYRGSRTAPCNEMPWTTAYAAEYGSGAAYNEAC